MIEKHTLDCVLNTPKFKAFYLREDPGMRMQSTLIMFTPEGTWIGGDLCPEENKGVMSNFGYGLDWFSSKLDGRYLCEKFLRESWDADRAKREIVEMMRDRRGYEIETRRRWAACLREFVETGRYEECGDLVDAMYNAGLDTSDGPPGYGYNERSRSILERIQKRFAELYDPRMLVNPGATA